MVNFWWLGGYLAGAPNNLPVGWFIGGNSMSHSLLPATYFGVSNFQKPRPLFCMLASGAGGDGY